VNTKAIEVDPYSLATVHLTMKRDDMNLSIGTGFLWRSAQTQTPVLVTCWHCLTGTNPIDGTCLSPRTAARPNWIKMKFRTANPYETIDLHQSLYQDDGRSGWVVHPKAKEQIDIAAFPIGKELPDNVITSCINKLEEQPIRISVGSELFVLGHPKNMGIAGLPVWKRASLASEPGIFQDHAGLRRMYIDTATREGMSGAPVIARSYGTYLDESKPTIHTFTKASRFVGLYSGRIGSESEFGAQLGIVWPRQLIETIVNKGVRDNFELDGNFTPTVEPMD